MRGGGRHNRRNSGPSLILAAASQASRALTGHRSVLPTGSHTVVPCASWSFLRHGRNSATPSSWRVSAAISSRASSEGRNAVAKPTRMRARSRSPGGDGFGRGRERGLGMCGTPVGKTRNRGTIGAARVAGARGAPIIGGGGLGFGKARRRRRQADDGFELEPVAHRVGVGPRVESRPKRGGRGSRRRNFRDRVVGWRCRRDGGLGDRFAVRGHRTAALGRDRAMRPGPHPCSLLQVASGPPTVFLTIAHPPALRLSDAAGS